MAVQNPWQHYLSPGVYDLIRFREVRRFRYGNYYPTIDGQPALNDAPWGDKFTVLHH
jgi:hypothetical protein